MNAKQQQEAGALRATLGRFPTGVAVVTTVDAQGQPVGMTINSFASVSLEPALVSWCIDRRAASYPVFAAANRFAISILAADQADLATRFATRGADKFHDIPPAGAGAPLIPGACAWFYCRRHRCLQLGDHAMLVGEVVDFRRAEHPPLVFGNGRFLQLDPAPLARAA